MLAATKNPGSQSVVNVGGVLLDRRRTGRRVGVCQRKHRPILIDDATLVNAEKSKADVRGHGARVVGHRDRTGGGVPSKSSVGE